MRHRPNGLYNFTDDNGIIIDYSQINHPGKIYLLDISKIHDKEQLLKYFAQCFKWPEYFGENWDGFADLITDRDFWPSIRAYILHLKGLNKHPLEKKIRTELEDACDFWQDEEQDFYILCDCPRLPFWRGDA